MTVIDAPGVPARGIECDAERKGRKEAEVSSTTPTLRIPSRFGTDLGYQIVKNVPAGTHIQSERAGRALTCGFQRG
jgi:hypothetical protein